MTLRSQYRDTVTRILGSAVIALVASSGASSAGPPYATDDPEPPDLHHWEAVIFTEGQIVKDGLSGSAPAIEFNYGAYDNLQLSVSVPLAFDAPNRGGVRFGKGSVEFGAKYRFIQEDEAGWRPQIAFYPSLDIPIAPWSHGFGESQPTIFLPLWAQKSFGRNWTLDAGGGYDINRGSGGQNYWFVSALVQRRLTDAFEIGAEMFHQTAAQIGEPARTGFNIGATYDLDQSNSLLFAVGRDLGNGGKRFAWYLGYELTG